MAQGKEREVNQALHLFAATELRKAYGSGNNTDMTYLGEYSTVRYQPTDENDHEHEHVRGAPRFLRAEVVLMSTVNRGSLCVHPLRLQWTMFSARRRLVYLDIRERRSRVAEGGAGSCITYLVCPIRLGWLVAPRQALGARRRHRR